MKAKFSDHRLPLNSAAAQPLGIAAASILLLLSAGAVSAKVGRTWTVDDDRSQYSQADFITLKAAVAAAAPGDTIVVYPGIYDADLAIGKTLTLSGPKSGQDARTRPVNENEEAILQAAPGLRLALGADDIVLDGFLLRIPTSDEGQPPGVRLDPGFSGCEIINDVFDYSGLEADSNGQKRTLISRNRFEGNGDFFGLFTASGPGVWLQDCDFINAPVGFFGSDAIVVTGGKFSGPALRDETSTLHLRQCRGSLVQNNTFTENADLGLTELENASVKENTFRGGRIWITLVHRKLTVEKNHFSQCPVAVLLNNEGPGPSGADVRFNEVEGGDIGVLVSGDSYENLIQENTIESNRIGIQVSSPAEAFSGFNTFRGNQMLGNSEIDCIDMTVGTGTAGTANLWKSNTGTLSSPAGLLR